MKTNIFIVKKENISTIRPSLSVNGAFETFSWVIGKGRCSIGEKIGFVHDWKSNTFLQGTIIGSYQDQDNLDRTVLIFKPNSVMIKADEFKNLPHGQEKGYFDLIITNPPYKLVA